MNLGNKIIIISLIFTIFCYIVLSVSHDSLKANSFLWGSFAAMVDLWLLFRLIQRIFSFSVGWLVLPVSLLRWGIVALVLVVAFYKYNAVPIYLVIGVAIPFLVTFIFGSYFAFKSKAN